MNTTEYLANRGWKLARTRFEGRPAQWVSPYENAVYPQTEALKIEKAHCLAADRLRLESKSK